MKPLFKLYTLILLGLFALLLAPNAHAQEDKFSQDELNEILGPVALYPDPLLAQVLPAATYPLEVVEAARLIKDESDFDKIDNQDWDPSVKAIARYPSVLKTMSEDLQWTQKVGQAFLDQQEEVMSTVQDLRQKAQANGHLKTTKQQVVKVVEKQIEIVPAEPEVIYVPVYSPRIVYYRPWWYYPEPVISFGIGWHIGAWLDIGFYWPHHHVYYCGPRYWYGGWYVHHPHAYYSRTAVVNNVTNVYYAGKQSRVVGGTWAHNVKHGNPYNGRVLKKAGDINTAKANVKSRKAVTLNSGRTQNVTRKLDSGTVKQTQDNNVKTFQNGLKKTSVKATSNTPRISTKSATTNSSGSTSKVSVSKSKSGSNSNSVNTSTKTRKSSQHVSTSATGSSKPTNIKYSTSSSNNSSSSPKIRTSTSSNSVSHSSISRSSSSSSPKVRTSSSKVSSSRPKTSKR